MRHGLDQIQHRITTWLRHRENSETLSRSGKTFLITKDIDLSKGRYRRLEWYEGDLFLTLAWRHGMHEERGELMLELEQAQELHKTYFVYEGDLSFDDLVGLAREGGVEVIRNEDNRGEWVEATWT